MSGACRGLGGMSEGKTTLERHSLMWEDLIKMDRQVVSWGGMGWIDLVRIGAGGGLL